MSASRPAMSIITTSVSGSADLFEAMHTNILPRTFSAGVPQAVVTSTSGNVRPICSTRLNPLARAMDVQGLVASEQRPAGALAAFLLQLGESFRGAVRLGAAVPGDIDPAAAPELFVEPASEAGEIPVDV